MVKMDGQSLVIEHVFVGLTLPANSWWRSKMARHNEQKEANDSEIISDGEVWSAIRYLDPESDHRDNDVTVAIVVLAIASVLSMIMLLVHEW
jgi:hypothetical protein